MTLHTITFVHPIWILVGLALSVTIAMLGARVDRKRRLALASFGLRRKGASSTLSRIRRVLKRSLLVAGALLGCAALARPQWGARWQETHRRGLDLLFALDASKSMLAPDVKPDRLTRAKLAIRDLLAKFDGNRVGLVAFSGEAFLQCPLTLDRGIFAESLDAIDTNTISRGGTDVGRAIDVARAALHNQPANRKLLVLLTDGEDLAGHALQEARLAAADGIHIYTIGIGTPAGELIPLADEPGQFVHDEKGGFVRSQLDDSTLQAIAHVTGGEYRRLGTDSRGLEALYQDVLAKLPRDELTSRMRRVPIERFQWPLGAAILCFAIEPLLGERRRQRLAEEPAKRWPKLVQLRRRVAVVSLLGLFGGAGMAQASPRQAERDYREGKFRQSADEYGRELSRSPADVKLAYNLGVAAYKSGDFDKAKDALTRSLRSDRLDLQENAYYDLGNVLFRAGQQTLAKQPEQTKARWQQAVASYDSALKLAPKDADAIYNRDLVKRKLAELEQQQKQQKQQNQQKQNSGDQKKDSSGKSGNQNGQKGKQENQNQPGGRAGGGPNQQNGKGPKGQPKQQEQQGQQANRSEGQHGKQDRPKQQAQNPQPNQGQQGQQGQQKPPTAQTGALQPSPGDESRGASAEPEVPGKLSKNDARELLDALRGDERVLPMGLDGEKHSADDIVRKDW
jgi:Ca-activated chloride channel family protein